MRATSIGPRRTFALLASLSLALCVHCGSSADDDLFGGGATGAGGSPPTSGGAAPQGGLAGATSSGGQAGATGGSSSGGATTGGVSSAGAGGVGGAGGAGAAAGIGGAGGSGGGACDALASEICDGVDNDCNDEIDDAKACPAKCLGFVAHGGRYMVCDTSTGQAKASTLCEEQGMRLAWLDSAEENTAVTAAIQSLAGIAPELLFIGASDAEVEGSWQWIGGAPFWEGEADGAPVGGAFANWAEGRPNDSGTQDCAMLIVDFPADGEPGQWNDTGCATPRGALCELP
jgi:hypothetical protein